MASTFWSQNPCVPSWVTFFRHAWNKDPPNLLETDQSIRQIPHLSGVQLVQIQSGALALAQLPEFWASWFSISKSCRSTVPLTHLQTQVKEGVWDVFVAVAKQEIIGTLVRRWCSDVWVHGVKWGRLGIVDYYCVHPGWRRKGVGRALLSFLHNSTKAPIPPHLIFWEGIMPSIPPLSTGFFWALQTSLINPKSGIQGDSGRLEAWRKIPKGTIWSEKPGKEIWLGRGRGLVAIWDTLHRSVPEGKRIGIYIGAEFEEEVETMETPFGVLLACSRISGLWSLDSPYQWIAYNMKYGSIQFAFPQLGL